MANRGEQLSFQPAQEHSHGIQSNFVCLCGKTHPYEKCYHLNPSIRPERWTTSAQLITNINQQIDNNLNLRMEIFDLGYEHYECLCGNRHAYKACFYLNPNSKRYATGDFQASPGAIAGAMSRINSQLHQAPLLAEKVRDLGYEDYKCLCGAYHKFHECFNLNPSERPSNFGVKESIVKVINQRLEKNPDLRERILALGYEYYETDTAKLSSLFSPRLEQRRSMISSSPLFKVSEKKELQLANLPTEILTQIVEATFELTRSELPESHPLFSNIPSSSHATRGSAQAPYRRPPAKTVLKNYMPPTSKTGYRERNAWLRNHPGKWGPIFQIMFVSKQFYDIAKPIRFREVHANPKASGWGIGDLFNRMSNMQVVQELTKHVHLHSTLLDADIVFQAVNAFKSLPNLKHVCVGLRESELGFKNSKFDQALMGFFELKIETLTFIWAPWDAGNQFPRDISYVLEYVEEAENAVIAIGDEFEYEKYSSTWLKEVFEKSSWYSGSDENEPIATGKAKHIRDWTATRGYNGKVKQWPMDRFIFGGHRKSPCPTWNLSQNPFNHPSQLNAKELKATQPVLEWRKGFPPCTEEERQAAIMAENERDALQNLLRQRESLPSDSCTIM